MPFEIERDRFNRPVSVSNTSRPTVGLDLARQIDKQPDDGGAREDLIRKRRQALARLGESQEKGEALTGMQKLMEQRLAVLRDIQAGFQEKKVLDDAAIQEVEAGARAAEFGHKLGESVAATKAKYQTQDLIDQFKPDEPGPGFLQRAIGSENTTDDNFFEYARELEGAHRLRQFQQERNLLGENGQQRMEPFVAGLIKEGVTGNNFQRDLNFLRQRNFEKIAAIPVETQTKYNRLLQTLYDLEDPRNNLYENFISYVSILRPTAFLMENVVFIGSVPAGYTAALYTARSMLEPMLFDGELSVDFLPGGQLMTTTEVDNYTGFPEGISGADKMDIFMN